MVTQNRYGEDYTGTGIYFIITNSENKMYKEIDEFIENHKSDDNSIWLYIEPVKPSKVNLRPEYCAELHVCEKNDGYLHLFQIKIWG